MEPVRRLLMQMYSLTVTEDVTMISCSLDRAEISSAPVPTAATATLVASGTDLAPVITFICRHGGRSVSIDQHHETEDDRSFVRLRWNATAFDLDRGATRSALARLGGGVVFDWSLRYSDERARVAVLASKAPHCLHDLLLSHSLDQLGGDVVAVISNHDTLRSVADHFGVPFHQIPVRDKEAAERQQLTLLRELNVDLVVLARYMQILTPAFVRQWRHKMINIHHSLLPAFVGARPYHQAYQRGVKVIGATAHYVTDELDQGPIIDQDACRVSHRESIQQLQQRGCEIERQVLTRAVRLHLAHKVAVAANRTIVFA
jgi:formyltetrahydrofolate deformylase